MPDDDHNTTDHAALLAEIERERQSRLAAQVRVEQLHAEVARLEPMRQRAADIARLTRERDEARADLAAMLNPTKEIVEPTADTKTLREAAEVARILQSTLGATRNSSGLDKYAKNTWDLCQRVMDDALAAQARLVAEPEDTGAEQVVHYTVVMGSLRPDGGVRALVFADAPTNHQPAALPVRKPLTEAQALAAFNADSHGCFADFLGGVRFSERAHGITGEPTAQTEPMIPAVLEAAKAASGHLQYRNRMLQAEFERARAFVPDGYALVSKDALRAWGKLDEVRAMCVYPFTAAQNGDAQ